MCSPQRPYLCPAYHPAYVMDLTWVFITIITLDKMRDRAGFYQQLDLTHESKPRVLLRIARTVVIKLAYTAEFLYYHTVDFSLSRRRYDRLSPDIIFLAGEIPELARDDGLAYKLEKRVLVIYVLILLLNPEHCRFSRTMARLEEHMSPESRERFSIMVVGIALNLLISVLFIYPWTPTGHVDRIVIQQLELAVKFRYVVPGGGAGVKDLVFHPAEYGEYVSCPLRYGISNLIRFVEHEAQPPCRLLDELHEIAFQLAEHGCRYYQECPRRNILKSV